MRAKYHIQFIYTILLLPALLWLNLAAGQGSGTGTQNQGALGTGTGAQNPAGTGTAIVSSPTSPVINLNLDLKNFSTTLPFDIGFKIVGGATTDKIKLSDIKSIDCYYIDKGHLKDIPTDTTELKKWKHVVWINDQSSNQYYFDIDALAPNKQYTFIFKYQRVLTDTEQAKIQKNTKSTIAPLIYNLAVNVRGLNDDLINKTVTEIETKIKTALTQDGLTAVFQDKDDHLSSMILKVVETYKTTTVDLNDLNQTLKTFDDITRNVNNFEATYKNIPNPPDKPANITALDNFLTAMGKLDNLYVDTAATNPANVKTYLAETAAVSTVGSLVNLPNDKAFQSLKQQAADMAGSMGYKFSKYAADLASQTALTNDDFNAFIKVIATRLYNDVAIPSSSVNGSFVTRSNTYVIADAGIAVMPGIAKLTPYIGTNFYFRPVNSDAPLDSIDNAFPGECKHSFCQFMGKRFSLVMGVSFASVARPYVRTDLLGSSFNLMTGAGFRLNGWVHLSGGFLWYSKLDPNPLNTNTSIAKTPFISLSFDLRIKTAINTLFSSSAITSVSP